MSGVMLLHKNRSRAEELEERKWVTIGNRPWGVGVFSVIL